jgi:hypothetical protein
MDCEIHLKSERYPDRPNTQIKLWRLPVHTNDFVADHLKNQSSVQLVQPSCMLCTLQNLSLRWKCDVLRLYISHTCM